MKTSETNESTRSPAAIDASFQAGKREGTQKARNQSTKSNQASDQPMVSNTRVFGEVSSKLSDYLTRSAPLDDSIRAVASGAIPDVSSLTSPEPFDIELDAVDADTGLPRLHFPDDFRAAMTELLAGGETSSARQEGLLLSHVAVGDAPDLEEGGDPLAPTGTGGVDGPETVDTQDQVISASARAASALAAGIASVPFGAVALGAASNLADFVAPTIVDGIKNPLARSAAAAAFSGTFLGMTASVTNTLGNDLANHLGSRDRITPNEPEGGTSRGAKLLSAVQNQTIPAFIGFGAAFTFANTLDAEAGVMGDTELNTETVLLKLARATAGGVGLGLAQEAAKSFSDHTLTRTEADRLFDNTRSLGEAIKKNVTSLPKALSAYTRPTERGKATEFGNVLGAAFGFATYAAIYGVIDGALKNEYGEETGDRLSEPDAQAAIATAAGVAGFVIADQLTRNIYANVMPVREVPDADDVDIEIPEIAAETGLESFLDENDYPDLGQSARSRATSTYTA